MSKVSGTPEKFWELPNFSLNFQYPEFLKTTLLLAVLNTTLASDEFSSQYSTLGFSRMP